MVRMRDEATPELLEAARARDDRRRDPVPVRRTSSRPASRPRSSGSSAAPAGGQPSAARRDRPGGRRGQAPARGRRRSARPRSSEPTGDAAAVLGRGRGDRLVPAPARRQRRPRSGARRRRRRARSSPSRAFSDDAGRRRRGRRRVRRGAPEGRRRGDGEALPGPRARRASTPTSPPSVVAAPRSECAPGIEPFEAAVAAGIDLVMVANATYTALDPDAPAGAVRARRRARASRPDRVRRRRDHRRPRGGLDRGHPRTAEDAAVDAARAGADVLLFASGAAPAAIAARAARARSRGLLDRAALEESYCGYESQAAASRTPSRRG